MVILTDGGDNGSHFNIKDAIKEAQRADIMIYTIYYSNGGGDESVLKDMSRQPADASFRSAPAMTLQQIYATIAADLRLQYEIGYRPPDSPPEQVPQDRSHREGQEAHRPGPRRLLHSQMSKENGQMRLASGHSSASVETSLRDVVTHLDVDHAVLSARSVRRGSGRCWSPAHSCRLTML